MLFGHRRSTTLWWSATHQALEYPRIKGTPNATMLPRKHCDCFHISKEETEAKPSQVPLPWSCCCQNRIGAQIYKPLDSELPATKPHH